MRLKTFIIRMIPMIILVIATIAMSLNVYEKVIENEKEICWNRLEIATNSTAGKIQTRINDNINFLTAISDTYILTHGLDDYQAVGKYLNSVMEQTIYSRIDVILPNNSIITQEGIISERGGQSTFEELSKKGTHITQRLVSSFNGEYVICCVTPIEDNNEILGILVGTLSCKTLSELFEVFTYGGSAQLYLIDRFDGNYLMDNWHEDLGNIYDLGLRESIDGKEMLDFVPAIMNGEYARFGFISQKNNKAAYQYCAPIDKFNWEVCVVVQEDIIFENLNYLNTLLMTIGIVELIVVLFYVFWNIFINVVAIKSENKVKKLEFDEAKNQAKSMFLSNMSHDIKTPLNGIIGMLHIIKNHRDDEKLVNDCLGKIEKSSEYLSTLTSDILYISEIENDKLILPFEPMNLSEMITDLSFIMERQAKDAGVSYSIDSSGLTEPNILGSIVHIKRVLVNIISNAIKYSKNAGKKVWVKIYNEENTADKKQMYYFIIKDNGIGMSEEFQKDMYKAFEQENVSARSEYDGYGLGLTIVNHLVNKMNGKITLDSKLGVGSTFIITIPFETAVINNQVKQSEIDININNLRILLVDDNELNLEIANMLLIDGGAKVDKAINGKIAIEMFLSSPINTYDIILMDIMMPEMNGYEATKIIRNSNRDDSETVPIIAMTANTFTEDIARCKEVGINAHVPKPIDVEQLMLTIMNCHIKR